MRSLDTRLSIETGDNISDRMQETSFRPFHTKVFNIFAIQVTVSYAIVRQSGVTDKT
jgi:hypothetical protein